MDGLLVLEVASDSPAERAGLLIGDILVGANGARLGGDHSLPEAIDAAARGNALQLDIVRGGEHRAFTVSLQTNHSAHTREAA